jgi:hypothetical protein
VVARPHENDDAGDGDDQDVLLAAALTKARKLVAELERQQREMAESPPPHHQDLPPAQLAEGQQAFANAVAAARRMLKALEDAAAIPPDER